MKWLNGLLKRNRSVFNGITIKLSGPICGCDVQNLSWTPTITDDGYGLKLSCSTCNTELKIPRKQFRAGFQLDRPYPGKKPEKPEKPEKPDAKVLQLVFGGKEDQS